MPYFTGDLGVQRSAAGLLESQNVSVNLPVYCKWWAHWWAHPKSPVVTGTMGRGGHSRIVNRSSGAAETSLAGSETCNRRNLSYPAPRVALRLVS